MRVSVNSLEVGIYNIRINQRANRCRIFIFPASNVINIIPPFLCSSFMILVLILNSIKLIGTN